MRKQTIVLLVGGIIGLGCFSGILYTLYDYEHDELNRISDYSCYQLEFKSDGFKQTSQIYKEMKKEFQQRDCESIRGNLK